jgi:alkylation response protein AidB-like acyl-CoA dehydrogenase
MLEWFLVNEQFGRVTNGLHWNVPGVYNVWEAATPEQARRYVPAALRGEGGDAYAVTEAEAGSDPGAVTTTAVAADGGWRLDGEKWFVTSGDVARVLIVMANVIDGEQRLPTLLLVDPAAPGVEFVDDPRFTHNYPHGHPTIRFTDVRLAADAVVGGVGEGDELQRRWFTEERLGIATHGLGAMWRLLDETTDWALTRVQGGRRIMDYQGISFPLADSATDATLGRLLALQVCAMVDGGADPKLLHAKASMVKLFVSEAAGRCADRAVQAFGGRGYMRDNVAERFARELRVDRIWEGTSEIQRLIIARALERRGVEATIH